METNFRKKTSNILVTVLIGFIVVSFMFTGYESMKGTPDTVINVGGKLVKAQEFKNEYDRQINFYRQITGGKNLTSQQIEQFGIKKNIIANLVNRKLMLHLSDRMNLHAAPEEITSRIKDLPYFKSGEQFDINRYKGLLAANGLNPAEFEEQISNEVVGTKTQDFFKFVPFSDPMVKDIISFKKEAKSLNLAQIKRNVLWKFVPVLNSEIKDYLSKEVNMARVENSFKERKPTLDKPEKIKASHILISAKTKDAEKKINEIAKKVTVKNFEEMAKKYTEDPSKKGSLGEFGRGRMVPAFEQVAFSQKPGQISKPVKTQFGYHIILTESKTPADEAKFEDHRDEIAKELIQKSKKEELDKLMASLKEDLERNFKQKDMTEIKRLAKKYNVTLEENTTINKYEGSTSQIPLSRDAITEIFNSNVGDIKTYEKPDQIIVAMVTSDKPEMEDISLDVERKGLANAFGRKYQQAMIENIKDNVDIKVYSNLIQ
jgi:peptidyl-prolyl cis-trans isomerase D